jgi:hypothetical protein
LYFFFAAGFKNEEEADRADQTGYFSHTIRFKMNRNEEVYLAWDELKRSD